MPSSQVLPLLNAIIWLITLLFTISTHPARMNDDPAIRRKATIHLFRIVLLACGISIAFSLVLAGSLLGTLVFFASTAFILLPERVWRLVVR